MPHTEGAPGGSREGVSTVNAKRVSGSIGGASVRSTEGLPTVVGQDMVPRAEATSGAPPPGVGHHVVRRGKDPPVDPFTGEKLELRLDDWLPNLERVALWNGWTDEERLANHLRGRALLE